MLDRLYKLERDINELEKFRSRYNEKDLEEDLQVQWILRYGLFEAIQIVIDITCHLVSKFNIGNAKTYVECIELLKKEKYLSTNLCDRLIGMVGLRNILIHEYNIVDNKKLYYMLNNLNDFREFAKEVKELV